MDCMIDLKNSRKRARRKVELPADSEYFDSATSLQGVLSSTTPSLPYNAAAIPVCTIVEERAPHLHHDEYGKSAIAVGDADDIFVFDNHVNKCTENLNSLTKAIFPAHQASSSSTVYQQPFANSGDSSRIMLKPYPEEYSFAQVLHNRSRNLISIFISEMSARDRIEMMNESEVEAEVEADIDSSYVRNNSLSISSDNDNNGDRNSSGIGTSARCTSNMVEAAENHIPCFTLISSEVFHESSHFNNDSAIIDRNSAEQSLQYQRYEDITKERKKKKGPSDSSDRMISTTGEKKPRIGPTGREIFVFDEAAVRRHFSFINAYI